MLSALILSRRCYPAVLLGGTTGTQEVCPARSSRTSAGSPQISTPTTDHEGTIIEMVEKGAVIALPYGVEGFATPKHLVKEDGSQAKVDEKLNFKVIEFNKDSKRIILSHSRIFEDEAKAERNEARKAKRQAAPKRQAEEPAALPQAEKRATLGDLEALAELRDKLAAKK